MVGPMMKPKPKAEPMMPKNRAQVFRRDDVGDIGVRRGKAACGDAVEDAADIEPAQRRREGHEQEIDKEAEDRDSATPAGVHSRSDSMPRIGPKMNCISPQVVANSTFHSEALAVSPWVNCLIRFGRIGIMMPNETAFIIALA